MKRKGKFQKKKIYFFLKKMSHILGFLYSTSRGDSNSLAEHNGGTWQDVSPFLINVLHNAFLLQ